MLHVYGKSQPGVNKAKKQVQVTRGGKTFLQMREQAEEKDVGWQVREERDTDAQGWVSLSEIRQHARAKGVQQVGLLDDRVQVMFKDGRTADLSREDAVGVPGVVEHLLGRAVGVTVTGKDQAGQEVSRQFKTNKQADKWSGAGGVEVERTEYQLKTDQPKLSTRKIKEAVIQANLPPNDEQLIIRALNSGHGVEGLEDKLAGRLSFKAKGLLRQLSALHKSMKVLPTGIQKAKKNIGQLKKKVITNKQGKKQTVYVGNKEGTRSKAERDWESNPPTTEQEIVSMVSATVKKEGISASRKEVHTAIKEAVSNLSYSKDQSGQAITKEVVEILKDRDPGQLRSEAVQHAAKLGLHKMVDELKDPKKVSDKDIADTIDQLRSDVALQKKQRRYQFT